MTRKFLWGIIVVLLVTNLTTVLIWMNANNGDGIDITKEYPGLSKDSKQVVALVGDVEITNNELYQNLQTKYGQQELEDMINDEVVKQLVERNKIKISDKVIAREIDLMETMLGTANNEDIKARRTEWKKEVESRLYLEELLTNDIVIKEEDLKEFYKNHKDQYNFEETYQLSQILVKDQEEADKVEKELKNGADFTMLAREYSIDDYTRNKGGYLGYFSKDSQYLPSIYYDKASNLQEGAYSQPFNTEDGVVILYLHQKLPAIEFTYDEIRGQIKRELALDSLGESASAKLLWEQIGVDWIYGDS